MLSHDAALHTTPAPLRCSNRSLCKLVFVGWIETVIHYNDMWAYQVAQWWRIHLPMQETWVWSLAWEALLEEEVAMHSSIIGWITLWTEEPGRLQVHGVAKHQTWLSDWARAYTHTHIMVCAFLFQSTWNLSMYHSRSVGGKGANDSRSLAQGTQTLGEWK